MQNSKLCPHYDLSELMNPPIPSRMQDKLATSHFWQSVYAMRLSSRPARNTLPIVGEVCSFAREVYLSEAGLALFEQTSRPHYQQQGQSTSFLFQDDRSRCDELWLNSILLGVDITKASAGCQLQGQGQGFSLGVFVIKDTAAEQNEETTQKIKVDSVSIQSK